MSMIYNRVERIEVTRKPANLRRDSRTIREAAQGFRTAVVATIGTIGAIAWGIALAALIG